MFSYLLGCDSQILVRCSIAFWFSYRGIAGGGERFDEGGWFGAEGAGEGVHCLLMPHSTRELVGKVDGRCDSNGSGGSTAGVV